MNSNRFAECNFQAEFLVCGVPCSHSCQKKDFLNERKEIKLLSEISFFLPGQKKLTISPGFIFDGASIPRICWTASGHPLEHRFLYAALLHDALYAAQYLPRKTADLCFRDFLRDFSGCGTVETWKMYSAVRLFGGNAWAEKTEKQIQSARTLITLKEVSQ